MSANSNERATGNQNSATQKRDSQASPEFIPTEVDLAAIGMGPGREDVAGRLAEAGQHVAGIENKFVVAGAPNGLHWDDTVAVDRFADKGDRFVRRRCAVIAPGVVRVGDEYSRARRGLVIATGSSPITRSPSRENHRGRCLPWP